MNASEIAKWFLAKNKFDYDLGITDELISNLKLQKLLYYAQGVTLALTDKPLFGDEIEAWEHGPVVPEIYHKYKNFGRNGIEFDENFDCDVFPSQINGILDTVNREFGQFSAWKLRDMTHNETPWKSTLKNQVISTDIIKKYFTENYVEQ